MKFSAQSKTLLAKLTAASKAMSPKTAIDILNYFLFRLDNGTLHVTASDQENIVTVAMAVSNAEGNGKVCINAKRILALLKVMPDAEVNFDIDDSNLEVNIKYTNGEYNLVGQSGDVFPESSPIPDEDVLARLNLPTAVVIDGLAKVSFAASEDALKPQLQGVLWDLAEDAVVFVATDTRQLAKFRTTRFQPGVACPFILSTKTVQLLPALIGQEANVAITVTEKSVEMQGEGYKVRTLRVAGNYPNYNRVIPTQNINVATFNRAALSAALERVGLCAPSSTNLVRLTFTMYDVKLHSSDISTGYLGQETVACDYSGAEMTVGLSATILSKILENLPTETAQLRLNAPNTPLLILPSENDEHGELTIVMMPMSFS